MWEFKQNTVEELAKKEVYVGNQLTIGARVCRGQVTLLQISLMFAAILEVNNLKVPFLIGI
jgi:hypothetical protein